MVRNICRILAARHAKLTCITIKISTKMKEEKKDEKKKLTAEELENANGGVHWTPIG